MRLNTLDLATLTSGVSFSNTNFIALKRTAALIFGNGDPEEVNVSALVELSLKADAMAQDLLPGWPMRYEADAAAQQAQAGDSLALLKLCADVFARYGETVEFPTFAEYRTEAVA